MHVVDKQLSFRKNMVFNLQPGCEQDFIAFDGGNRFIKWITPSNQLKRVPSCVLELGEYDDKPFTKSANTLLIEVNSKTYLIGGEAIALGGKWIFNGDKCEMARITALAALQPKPGFVTVDVKEFRFCLPDSRSNQDVDHFKSLVGEHNFIRDGVQVEARINKVQPFNETAGTYRKARGENLFKFPQYVNGIISLGGGDGIARLYTPGGQINREADVIVPGTKALAAKINKVLTAQTGNTKDPALLMDAVENGSYTLPCGTDFSKQFFVARDEWWTDIQDSVRNQWVKYFPQLGEVLIVGGSAELVRNKLPNDRFKVVADSQYFDLLGLAYETKNNR